jgi:hypothetical protein
MTTLAQILLAAMVLAAWIHLESLEESQATRYWIGKSARCSLLMRLSRSQQMWMSILNLPAVMIKSQS